jgi:hypothetical protein
LGAIVITVPDSKKKLAMSLDTRPWAHWNSNPQFVWNPAGNYTYHMLYD